MRVHAYHTQAGPPGERATGDAEQLQVATITRGLAVEEGGYH